MLTTQVDVKTSNNVMKLIFKLNPGQQLSALARPAASKLLADTPIEEALKAHLDDALGIRESERTCIGHALQ